jgi:hypothetical protein
MEGLEEVGMEDGLLGFLVLGFFYWEGKFLDSK